MGVAEELRTLAGAWDEWGLGGKLTELAERLEAHEVAEAQSVLVVVEEMERHISGVEWMQDSPVARWARELREVVAGKTEAEQQDSWEQLEEDALLDPCDYFNKKLSRECADCPASCLDSCVAQHSADLVRRAKALAERESGE